jgi:isoquinoline 1-oxidoreductase alpha subunit
VVSFPGNGNAAGEPGTEKATGEDRKEERMISITVNGTKHALEVADDTPLLWVLRDHLGLCGTKFGCGAGLCGACTVLVNGVPRRSCVTAVSQVAGSSVTTIEGIAATHPVKQAWLAEEVSQCGYCQPGQVMGAVALLAKTPKPTDTDIDEAMSGHLCRCGTYNRIRRAIHRAAGRTGKGGKRS